MSSKQAIYREVLASFVGRTPPAKGWWYRLPSKVTPTQDGQSLPFDAILPHMGTLFGLTELAMWVILYEMGCYKKKGDAFIINTQGWDDLKYEFKVKSFIEVSKSRLDGTQCTYIRLGFPKDKPTVIWKKYENKEIKKHPTAISSRASTKFVREELVKILKGSNMFLEVLKGHVKSYVEANGMVTAHGSKSKQINSSADDESAVVEEEKRRQQEQEMTEEKEEEKVEEAPPIAFNPRAGEVADPKQNPLMNLFNIPSDNMQTLTQLHKELTRTIQKQNSINNQDEVCDGSILYEDGRHSKLFIEIPKGKSKATFIKLRNIVVQIVKYCTDNDEDSLRQGAVKVIAGLESEFKESFLEVAKEKGYSTIQAGVMSAEYWTAMAEAANLRTTQQKVITRFLFHHFGHRVVVPQRKLAAYGSQYVKFETFTKTFKGRKVLYSYRDITVLLEFYLPQMLGSFNKTIDKMELTLGGDHGKGAFTFIACLIIRFEDPLEEPQVLEFQIGEIDSEKDSMELLLPLVEKLGEGLLSMNPKGEGDCTFMVHRKVDGKLSLHFDETDAEEQGVELVLKTKLELYINGDYKFLFMMAGRSGYCGDYCLYCRLRQSEWKRLHKSLHSTHCGAAEWTIESLCQIALDQEQKAGRGETFRSVGVREAPVWPFISIRRMLMPILHELLGLGNDLMSSFWGYVEEGAEPLEPDEIEARNMTLLAEIEYEDAKLEVEECELDLESFVVERLLLNEYLQETILTTSERKEINEQKKELSQLERSTRKKRDDLKEKARELKKLFDTTKATESDIRKKRGRAEKTLANSIESEVLILFKVYLSNFHGGDLVGEPIRILMKRGKEIFDKIREHIEQKADERENNLPSLEKLDRQGLAKTCLALGQMFQLLDGVFSLLLTKRGEVTVEVVETLKKRLELARQKWDEMGLSMTPKWHMLLNHAIEFLIRTGGGLIEMGEDRIERAHQLRERDRQRYSRLRNISKMKASQAKFQNLRLDQTIKLTQATVEEKSKRNLKRKVSLAEENLDSARATRNETRESVFEEVTMDEDRAPLTPPRVSRKRKLRSNID
jgi:hypothetical protein